MVPTSICPDRSRLQALLAGQLIPHEQTEIIEHVEICPPCQTLLDSLTPASRSWEDVAAQLQREPQTAPLALQQVIEQAKASPVPDKTEAEQSTPQGDRSRGDETQAESGAQRDDDDLAFLAAPTKPGAIGRLAHYEILEVVGKGGFGTVLKAFDAKLHRIVAIKVLSPELSASGTARQRFSREARAAAAVTHEHLVTIHAVEDDHRPPYLVMQLIDGGTLQEKLDKSGPLGIKEILRIGSQMAAGLAAAHKQGLVHRDIKPANVLLENGVERVKITDFGLARAVDDASVTQSGVVAGTPMYMSPEQANGLAIDHRSDLFSLGTVLYVMCTGRPPFRASGTMAVLKRVIDDTPRSIRETNPEVPDWLEAIIAKLHAKEPEDRFQTAREIADVLSEKLADLQAGRTGSDSWRAEGRKAPVDSPVFVVKYKLVGSDISPIPNPSPEVIRQQIQNLTGRAGIFLSLDRVADDVFVQTAWSPVGFVLQIHEGNPERSFHAVRGDFFADEVSAAFIAYLQGNEQWRTDIKWKEVDYAKMTADMEASTAAQAAVVGKIGRQFAGAASFAFCACLFYIAVFCRSQFQLSQWGIAAAVLALPVLFGLVVVCLPKTATVRPGLKNLTGLSFLTGLLVLGTFWFGGGVQNPGTHKDQATVVLGGPWDQVGLEKVIVRSVAIVDEKIHRDGLHMAELIQEPASVKPRKTSQAILPSGRYEIEVMCRPGYTVGNLEFTRAKPGLEVFAVGMNPILIDLEPGDEILIQLTLEKQRSEPGWVQLFNGKDLGDWKTHPALPGEWRVEDGQLVGKRGALFSERGDYQDFHLRIQAKLEPAEAGQVSVPPAGLFFRAEFGATHVKGQSKFPGGYFSALNNGDVEYYDAKAKHTITTSQFPLQIALDAKTPWYVQEIIVRGNRIIVRINGKEVCNHVDANLSYGLGHFVLYATPAVRIQTVEIKELPPVEPGWVQLFNGKDLTGWKETTVAPGVVDPQKRTKWTVEQGMLRSPPLALGNLRTEKTYENYVLKLEFKLMDPADSKKPPHMKMAVHMREWGARQELCLKIAEKAQGTLEVYDGKNTQGNPLSTLNLAQAPNIPLRYWNKLELTCQGNTIEVSLNGKSVSKIADLPFSKGCIALWSDSRDNYFRNFEIKELPPEAGALAKWGEWIDPKGDCKAEATPDKLTIRIPGARLHDLNPRVAFLKNLDAPRVLRSIDGDFIATLRVNPFASPQPKTSIHAGASYHGAGLLVWIDEKTLVRFERAIMAEFNQGRTLVQAEWFEEAQVVESERQPCGDGPIYLQIERRGDQLKARWSKDGLGWQVCKNAPLKLPRTIKIGPFGVNSTKTDFAPTFADFKIITEPESTLSLFGKARAEALKVEAALLFTFEKDTFFKKDGKTFVRDLTGNGNDCLCYDVEPDAVGRSGAGLRNERKGYLQLPKSLLADRPAFTIAGWIRANDIKKMSVFYQTASAKDPAQAPLFHLAVDVGGHIVGGVWNETGGWKHLTGSSELFDRKPNDWIFVAARYDSTEAGGTLRVTFGERTIVRPSQPVKRLDLTTVADFLGLDLNGAIDEVAVWQRKLSDEELHFVHMLGRAGKSLADLKE